MHWPKMKICRFKRDQGNVCIGLLTDDGWLLDLTPAGITELQPLLEAARTSFDLEELKRAPRLALSEVQLCAPVERQEVWAAGVTYLRSKKARMEESDFSANAYDLVYEAERPELFFKALPEKVVASGQPVGIRRDARWSVPEPELALVLNSQGKIAGYTIGNDMSSRDIEGENLLYLPQAKIYESSCALGPWIILGADEAQAREWSIGLRIDRAGQEVFTGLTSVDKIRRKFEDLAQFLFRSQKFPRGAILLTGTGIVPPDSFTLQEGDVIEIEISGIGRLRNSVKLV
jgi:2-dehydro-3-deoxy-D-arabinonate dehydratase